MTKYVVKMAAASEKNARESRFTNADKQGIADIICNQGPANTEGEPEEPVVLLN